MFELVTDCLVCIVFSCLRFGFCFGFSGVCVCAGSCGNAERPPETRHGLRSFFDRLPGGLLKTPRPC